ncbi:UDP-N-acetylmuramate dehydrogenase [Devosia sp. 2618]|uniref:UDP-N-acetylmuramate dehydrogenase n=1 Tax=Devosia sp. 2618 TaxID=3156454 RepID=UPI0033939135
MLPTPNFDLSPFNTLGLTAQARYGAQITFPDQVAELSAFAASVGLPLHIIGGGSNVVLHDMVEAVVGIMASKGRFAEQRDDGTTLVTAQAGEDWSEFVAWTIEQGHWGLENLAGIPGTVGAAPIQNIGAYGVELADRLDSLVVWDTVDKRERRFDRAECHFSYRQSAFKRAAGRFIVLNVTLALPSPWVPVLSYAGLDSLPPDVEAPAIMERVLSVRGSKLPNWRELGNVGSFFHNPIVHPALAEAIAGVPRYPQPDGSVKLSAAWLIDACGLKGHQEGGAGVYPNHALILVNNDGATYRDIQQLAATVRRSVKERFGVDLIQEPIEL